LRRTFASRESARSTVPETVAAATLTDNMQDASAALKQIRQSQVIVIVQPLPK
jgi:hypothetical protein